MAAIPSASKTIWKTFLDHVTRNASAVHNKEAWGLAKVKAKVVPGKRITISSRVNFYSMRLYKATVLAHDVIVSTSSQALLWDPVIISPLLGEPKYLYAEKLARIGAELI